MPNIIVDRRLFLTADKSRLVEPDDADAAFLWANTGDEVTEEQAAEVGYTDGTPKAENEADPGSGLTITKEADAPENKAVSDPDEDKSAEPVKAKRARKS